MDNFNYLNKDNLIKSHLIIFQNLDLYALLRILSIFYKKNKYLFVIIKKPKKKIYNFILSLGFQIKIFDWNLFQFEERFESHIQSYDDIEKYYEGIKSNTKFSNKYIETLYNDKSKIKIAPKKFYINILFEYLDFNIISKKIFKKNKNCSFYPPLSFSFTDKIYKKQFSSKAKSFNLIREHLHKSYFLEKLINIITKILFLSVLFLTPFFVLFKLRFKTHKEKQFNLAFRLYNSGFRFNKNENRTNWLEDNKDTFYIKKKSLYVAEDSLDQSFLNQIKKNNYNFVDLNIFKIKFVKKPFKFLFFYSKNLYSIFFKSIFCENQTILYYLISIYYYLKWTSFIQNYTPKNYLSYQDHNIQHIFRNTILDKIKCNQNTYKHTYCENIYNVNNRTPNIIYSFLVYKNEFHWGKRSILMSKQNLSLSSNFIISKPTHIKSKKKLEFSNINKSSIVLCAFASTYGNNCVNNENSHIIFLESLLSLIESNSSKRKISKIIFKGKSSYKNYLFSKNQKLRNLAIKIQKNKNFKIYNSSTSAQSIFIKSDITVSMSFSSTTIETLSIGKRAFFFDCLNQFKDSYYDTMPNLVAHNYNQFLKYVDYWSNIDKSSLKNYYKKYLKKEFGGYDLNFFAKDIIKSQIKADNYLL